MRKNERNFTIEQNPSTEVMPSEMHEIVPLNHELMQRFEREALDEINERNRRYKAERLEEINDKKIKAEAYLTEVKYLTRKKSQKEQDEERDGREKEIAARIMEKIADYEHQKKRAEGKLIAVTDYRRRIQLDCPEHLSPEAKKRAIDTSAKLHAFVETLVEKEEIPLEIAKSTLQNLVKRINYKLKLRQEEIEASIVNQSLSKRREVKEKEIEDKLRKIEQNKPIIITPKGTKEKKEEV
jgi:hypothetical protein